MTKRPTEQSDTTLEGVQEGAVAATGAHAMAPVEEGQTVRSAILELARDPAFDVAKLQALTAMQEHAEDRQAQRAFAADMARAQAEMQPVIRAAEVKLGEGKGSYKYASLDGIDEMLRPVMTKYGFSVTYDRTARTGDGGGFIVTGTLRHREGHSITASFPLSLDSGPGRSNAQAAGSTDSYGRKYILLGFFNIVRKNEDSSDGGIGGGGDPISLDEAAQIKKLVDEAGIGEGASGDDRKTVIVDWFDTMLGYELPRGYASIRQEDGVRVRRALLSLKAKHLTRKAEEVKI